MKDSKPSTIELRNKSRQKKFLIAIVDNRGRIATAGRQVNVTKQCHQNWGKKDSAYRKLINVALWEEKDSAYRKLRDSALWENEEPKKEPKKKPKKKRKLGRPTKYNPQVVKKICTAVSEGLPFKYAAALGGITYKTFCEWRKEYSPFCDAIEASVAEGIQTRLRLINSAGEGGDVVSSRWYLEHVFPEHYAKTRVDHQHHVEGNIDHTHAVAPEVLDAIAEVRRRNDSS